MGSGIQSVNVHTLRVQSIRDDFVGTALISNSVQD